MTEHQGSRKKILVVDDEPSTVVYLETLLQDAGYDTASARDGVEGMDKVRGEKPDLVSLDINMPEQSGIRFYRNLKDDPEFVAIPVMIVTAVTGLGGDPEEFHRFISTRKQIPPPDAFIPKPIDREIFLRTVSHLLTAEPERSNPDREQKS